MESINKKGDETVRFSKYNDYQEIDRQKRWREMMKQFKKHLKS